jgi:hypothetical protein
MQSTRTKIWAAMITLFFLSGVTSFAAEELYLVDMRETPGKILQEQQVSWSREPVLRPINIRSSRSVHTMAFHKYGRVYFIDATHRQIFAADGLTEETVFSFATPLQDIDFDSRGRMYFSAIDSEEGVIYHLNRHTGEVTRSAAFSIRLLADQTRGFWNGYFAFDPSDKLFLSIDDPQPGGSSIYEYERGRLQKRFTHPERIAGFTFASEDTIYFANAGNRVYAVRGFSEVTVRYEGRTDRMLNDVELVQVPEQGTCTISGQLRGGNEFWPITSVQVLGPNVLWRSIPGSSIRVAGNGSYVLRNLPNGRYRVSTDIRGDTMAGFEPRARMVDCGTTVRSVDFQFSRGH